MDKKTGFYTICDRLSLAALSLFTLECTLGCSGQWLRFGSISIRMALFAICFLLTLPNVFLKYKELLKVSHVRWTLLLGGFLLIAAVIGWRSGNARSFIKADITTFLALALLPGFLATITTRERLLRISSLIFYGALILGIFTVLLHFFFSFAKSTQINAFNDWINEHAMGGVAGSYGNVYRTYLRSHIFLQVGLLMGLQKIWCQKSTARRLLFLVAEAIMAFACLMTFTRGFWLGFALSAVFLLILCPQHWKRYLITAGCAGALLVALFTLSWWAYGKPAAFTELATRLSPALVEGAVFLPGGDTGSETTPTTATGSTDTSEESTDPTAETAKPKPPTPPATEGISVELNALKVRQDTLLLLGERIGDKPLFGSGLGANLDEIRNDGKVEYMYYDVILKTGFIGFALFCVVFFLPACCLLKCRIRGLIHREALSLDSFEMQKVILLCAYLGVAITSYLNPFLLNPMGIMLLMHLSAANRCENTK